jgi:hypothetical protein
MHERCAAKAARVASIRSYQTYSADARFLMLLTLTAEFPTEKSRQDFAVWWLSCLIPAYL